MEWFKTIAWNGLESNLWKFTVHLATNKRTYMVFLTIYLLTMPNTTAQTIGFLTLVGQIAGFLFEVPSGYVADRIGHKNALVLARSAMALSTLTYVFADNKYWFFIGTVLLSLGWALTSGTTDAFMQDTLAALKRDDRFAAIMGKMKSIGFLIPVAFILLLAFIAEENFRIAFTVAFVIDVIGLVAVYLLEQPPVEKHKVEEIDPYNIPHLLRRFIAVGWLPFVVAGALVGGIELGATIGFKNPYQEILGFSISTLGIFWALSRLIISGVLPFNGWIYERFSMSQFLMLEAGIIAIGFLGIGLTSNLWLVALLFILSNVAIWGLSTARSQYYLAFLHGSSIKATLLSIQELLKKIVIGLMGLIMGFLVHNVGFQNAYLMVGFLFVLILAGIMLFVPRIKYIRDEVE